MKQVLLPSHSISCRLIRVVASLCAILAISSYVAFGQVEVPRITGTWCSEKVCEELLSRYAEQAGKNNITFQVADNDKVSAELALGQCWIGVHRGPWGVPDQHCFDRAFGDVGKLESFTLGTYVVQVIVNAKNPICALSIEDLSGIYRGEILKWDGVPGGMKDKSIQIFSPAFTDTAYQIVGLNALQGYEFDKRLRDWSAQPLRMKSTSDAVIAAVAKDRSAIGFFLADNREGLDKRVKVLAIIPRNKVEAIAPSRENVVAGRYPLTQTLTMYLHPNAPRVAREFCDYATGSKTAKIVKEYKLWPEYELEEIRGQQRLADVKRKKGSKITVCDLTGSKQLLKDLGQDFVKARATAQLIIEVDNPKKAEGAIEDLFKGDIELVLANNRPMREGGKTSERVSAPAEPANPLSVRHTIVGRVAVGVIVHPKNILDALPLNEARGIFCGEITQWPGANGTTGTIHVYGPYATDTVSQLLKDRIEVGTAMPLKYTVLPDNQKVIVEVAKDPFAIGFVDLSQLSPAEKSVKLVNVYLPGQPEQVDTKGSSPHPDPLRAPTEGWSGEGQGDCAKLGNLLWIRQGDSSLPPEGFRRAGRKR